MTAPPKEQWPSVVCPYCAWRYAEWRLYACTDASDALAKSFERKVTAHILGAHPEHADEYIARVKELNGYEPKSLTETAP